MSASIQTPKQRKNGSPEVDELSRDFFVQLLFSYKVNPRTVLFAGYSDGVAENQDISRTTTGRSVFVKISYAWLW